MINRIKLSELLSPWIDNYIYPDCFISGLTQDSRLVKPGYLFLAYLTESGDGNDYISDAIIAGAVAVVYESDKMLDIIYNNKIIFIKINQLRQKISSIANRFYDNPSNKMYITGVTGTNGKTTIAYQLAQAHNLLNTESAYIGTLGAGRLDAIQPINNTTPGPIITQELLFKYYLDNIKFVAMEVSSHALDQDRVAAVNFNQAIYTNLTHDHLDYHLDMNSYALAKARLFELENLQYMIINQDDLYANFMIQHKKSDTKLITYGILNQADIMAYDISNLEFKVSSPWGRHNLAIKAPGRFNIYNTLAVFASLLIYGYDINKIENIISKLEPSPGRMQVVYNKPLVIVDYAHTPDALKNVLQSLIELKSKIWLVFGCGGERCVEKRPMMGSIASEYADYIILTNDNPRRESAQNIIADIAKGINNKANYITIIDREDAIKYALSQALPDDIVLIAGKGHENYQIIGAESKYFSDQTVVLDFFTS